MTEPTPPLGQRTLLEIAGDYVRAEITALWVHDRTLKRHIPVFVVAELCPSEQEPSSPIEDIDKKKGERIPMKRAVLGTDRTAYATRLFLPDPRDAVAFYRGEGGAWPLRAPGVNARLEPLEALTEEPPCEVPVLVSYNRGEDAFGAVFPRRHGALRVCSLLDVGDSVTGALSSAELEKLNAFSMDLLGVDLVRFPEYRGSIHLCMPNPLLRRMQERLSGDERYLLVEFLERDGCSIHGCTLELTDLRAGGEGFHLRIPLNRPSVAVPLPNPPDVLRTCLLNRWGERIEQTEAVFVKAINIRMHLKGARRRVRIARKDGAVEQHDIGTVAADQPMRTADTEQTRNAKQSLQEAQRRRELQLLEKNRTFLYFEGGPDSVRRALEILRELLQGAVSRCIICDPYLSAGDVVRLVPFIVVQRLPIQLLGSWSFLKTRLRQEKGHPLWRKARAFLRSKKLLKGLFPNGDEQTHADELLRCVRELSAQDQTLNIQCRVLRGGDKSPIHDRFLVIDDDVYLLGSSINEFGSRATTLFKAPDPERLIAELESRWKNTQATVALEELKGLPPESEEDGSD
jgi:hypothetical protein